MWFCEGPGLFCLNRLQQASAERSSWKDHILRPKSYISTERMMRTNNVNWIHHWFCVYSWNFTWTSQKTIVFPEFFWTYHVFCCLSKWSFKVLPFFNNIILPYPSRLVPRLRFWSSFYCWSGAWGTTGGEETTGRAMKKNGPWVFRYININWDDPNHWN